MFSGTSGRLALVVASGLAMALAWPKFDLDPLAWVALVPLLYAIEGQKPLRVLAYGFLQGFACYVGSLYWIVIPLNRFADVRMGLAVIPMLLLAAVLAVYTAVTIWAGIYTARRLRIPIVVTMPVAWAAVEWVRSFFPIGFPWNLLGYTAYRHLDLIQFAEVTGVYGVSALIVLFNCVVFVVLLRRGSRRLQMVSLSVVTGLMVVLIGFGVLRIRGLRNARSQGNFRVAMVQGNIPQSIKWDPKFLRRSFAVYWGETQSAARRGADLVVWPEAAAPFYFQKDGRYPPEFASYARYRKSLLALARKTSEPILFGAPALGVADGRRGFYNRAYLVSAEGKVEGSYDKIQLVPFGEYVPGRAVLGYFVNRIVEGFGDMIPGREQTLFQVKGAKLAVLICYESVFPDLTRRAVKQGADVLVNITNDAWYGRSSAPYQALAMAAMRSVETKVPMVRVANTGVSALILPTGEISARTPLFKRGTEIEDVAWRPMRTIYTMVGDLFAEICFVLTVVGIVLGRFRPRRLAPLEATVERILSANGRRTSAST